MEESDPYDSYTSIASFFTPEGFDMGVWISVAVTVFLLIVSALVSGSEVAYFSLSPMDHQKLKDSKSRSSKLVESHLQFPERLLATILIANNFVNVAIVVISTFITDALFDFGENELLGHVIQIGVVAFLILFFSEILPKIYANKASIAFARFTSPMLQVFSKIFWPISSILISSTSIVHKRIIKNKKNLSIDELSDALELTENQLVEEKSMLKGIVKFGNIEVSEIMRSRVDVVAVDINENYSKLIEVANESGYSRIPVYDDTFDEVRGILYIKDLLPHLNKPDTFHWQTLIRPSYFVPESKKINDLLKEFQSKRIHMAIVVDEYGGTSGIITLEDILEEIVGEITDESDEDKLTYQKIDNENYIFEGKTLLNDFYKLLGVDDHIFEDVKGDADTLAGLILELRGEIPQKGDKISYKQFKLEIKEVDKRRIKLIHVNVRNAKEVV